MTLSTYHTFYTEWNTFMLPCIIFGLLLLNAYRIRRKKRTFCLLLIFVNSLLLFTILEVYYFEQCPIDPVQRKRVLQVFHASVDALNHLNVDHVVMFGTLLYVLRNTTFGGWDQDSDLVIIKPNDTPTFINNLNKTLQLMGKNEKYEIKYYKHRNLTQIRTNKGDGHCDIWSYVAIKINGSTKLTNYDYTMVHNEYLRDMLFPAKYVDYNGGKIAVPNKAHEMAKFQFGNNYMIPYYNRIQCLENIVTFRISLNRCITYVAILISGNTIIVICVMFNRHMLFKINTTKSIQFSSIALENAMSISKFVLIMALVVVLNYMATTLLMTVGAQLSVAFGGNILWWHHDYIKPDKNILKCEIPKIIHQTYKTLDSIPERWKDGPLLWKKFHPDFEYMFWTDNDIKLFIQEHYPWFVTVFNAYSHAIQRVDAARYFIIYHYGGIYCDLDISPKRNIQSLLSNIDVMLVETPNLGATNSLFAARKHSDFLHFVIRHLEEFAKPGWTINLEYLYGQ